MPAWPCLLARNSRLLPRRADPFIGVGAVRAEKGIEVTAVVPRPTCALPDYRFANPAAHLEEPVLRDRLNEPLVEIVDSLASWSSGRGKHGACDEGTRLETAFRQATTDRDPTWASAGR